MSREGFWTGPVPSKAERRGYLLARGWTRVGASWRHPRFGPSAFFSLAAAYRQERGHEEAGS